MRNHYRTRRESLLKSTVEEILCRIQSTEYVCRNLKTRVIGDIYEINTVTDNIVSMNKSTDTRCVSG